MDELEVREGAPLAGNALSKLNGRHNNAQSLQADHDESKAHGEGESLTPRERLEALETAASKDWPPEILLEWNRRERENAEAITEQAKQAEQSALCYGFQLLDRGMPEAVAVGIIIAHLHLIYGSAYPSVETLAKRLKKSPDTVRAILAKMEKRGQLTIVPRHGKSSIYIPIFEAGHAIALP
jgi:hypothetical protein